MALGLDNLNLTGHLDHGTSVLHVAVSFSFGRANVNHVAFLYRMAVRYLNWVGNLDGNAFGLGVTVAFGFPVLDLNDCAFGFAFRNIDSFGAGNLGGDCFGDILANNLGDLCTNRPLGPAIFLFRRARMAFINHNGFTFVYNLGFNLVFHDGDHFGDILTNILTYFLRHHDRNFTGFGDTDFFTFWLVPKRRYNIKVIKE